MDLTCPELAKIDQTSDYGSNNSSCSSQQEEGSAGICTLPDGEGNRNNMPWKVSFYHTYPRGWRHAVLCEHWQICFP